MEVIPLLFSAVPIYSYATGKNHLTPKYVSNGFLTGYGMYGGISAAVFAVMYMHYGLPKDMLVLNLVAYLMALQVTCKSCSKGFEAITIYWLLLPLLFFSFTCPNFTSMFLIVVTALAIGRIGCLCGGCCTSRRVPPSTKGAFAYTHKDHTVNKRHNATVSYTYPTAHIEAIIQLATAYLAIKVPEHAVSILTVGSLTSIGLSGVWREQPRNKWGLAMALLMAGLTVHKPCPGTLAGTGTINTNLVALISVITPLILSHGVWLVA